MTNEVLRGLFCPLGKLEVRKDIVVGLIIYVGVCGD
jgi:hypothetical protein